MRLYRQGPRGEFNQISTGEKEELKRIMKTRWGDSFEFMTDDQFKRWERIARIKHKLGIHTFVPVEKWDEDSVQLIGEACWRCDASK